LAHFRTTAEQTYLETGVLKNFGGQSVWSPDSRQLVYTRRLGDNVEVRWHDLNDRDLHLASNLQEAKLDEWSEDNTTIAFRSTETIPESGTEDPSILVTDETGFAAVSWTEHAPEKKQRFFQYHIDSSQLSEVKAPPGGVSPVLPETYRRSGWEMHQNIEKYILKPVLSPDKKYIAFVGSGFYDTKDISMATRDYFIGIKRMDESTPPDEFLHSPSYIVSLEWNRSSGEVLGIVLDPEFSRVIALSPKSGETRELTRTPQALSQASWNKEGSLFVAVAQSTFIPDQLVKFDSSTGRFDILANPNPVFADKDRPEVRFMRVDTPLGGGIFGRLVLPNGYHEGQRYPLVFTTYRAGTEFLAGAVGDEFPIFPAAAHGIAVFAMDTGQSNLVSDSGDADFTMMRLKKPVEAMRSLRRQLADEGLIDPDKVGITGLSYGSDIAAYAVISADFFKASSVSLSALDPIVHTLGYVTFSKELTKRGLPDPNGTGYEKWKNTSVALNAPHIHTPILIQSPESEAMLSLETFKALKPNQTIF
jgi:dipeptidyl aminopeptidase/acylaminoacyl peptidase